MQGSDRAGGEAMGKKYRKIMRWRDGVASKYGVSRAEAFDLVAAVAGDLPQPAPDATLRRLVAGMVAEGQGESDRRSVACWTGAHGACVICPTCSCHQ